MSDEVPLKRIEKALQDDGVWVSPDLRSDISKADEQRIVKAVDEAKEDVYVAMVDVPYDDPMFHGDVESLFTIVGDDTGLQGWFIGMENYEKPAVTVVGGDDDFYAAQAAEARHPDDLADQVVDAIGLIDDGNALEVYNRLEKSGAVGTQPQSDDSELSTGVIIGFVIAALVVVVGVVLFVRGRKRLRREKEGFALPTNVMSTVREAERLQRAKQAKDGLLRLGERIDAATMTGASDAWQATLDHYELARRTFDGSTAPADVVGVIVLVERGNDALDAALAGREWSPARTCYFNPMHGAAVCSAVWGGDDGVDVPCCAACADALSTGATPTDILDFVDDGTPRHYFSLDLEPWSGTGYGALDADLIGRLRER